MSLGLGYNASDVIASIRAVNNAYNALMVALVNTTQSQFVNQMQDNWASEDAYQFFNLSFKPAIDEITSNATKVFQSVVDSMNSAGRAWAEFQKSTWGDIAFKPSSVKLDVSGIKNSIDGDKGANLGPANAAVANLNVVAQQAGEALEQAKSAVVNCGFLGGGMAGSLSGSLSTIKSNVDTSVDTLVKSTKTRCEKTFEEFGQLAAKTSSGFAGTEG